MLRAARNGSVGSALIALLALTACGEASERPPMLVPAPTVAASSSAPVAVSEQPAEPPTPADCGGAAACQARCDGGDAKSCRLLGVLLDEGRGGAREPERALAQYLKACDGHDAEGCFRAALATADDEARQIRLAEVACEGKYGAACSWLARRCEHGFGGVGKDLARARTLYRDGCGAGDAAGCMKLGVLLERGEGGPADPARAVQMYEIGCSRRDAEGCLHGGQSHEHGRGVAQDLGRAAELLRKGCDVDSGEACDALGLLTARGGGVTADPVQAKALFTRACGLNHGPGCLDLGRAWLSGADGTTSRVEGARFLQKACGMREQAGCDEARRPVAETRRACATDPDECSDYGYLQEHGLGLPASPGLAAGFYRQACDRGSVTGCVNLGVLYTLGRGVPQDDDRARASYEKACDKGSSLGCGLARQDRLGDTVPVPAKR